MAQNHDEQSKEATYGIADLIAEEAKKVGEGHDCTNQPPLPGPLTFHGIFLLTTLTEQYNDCVVLLTPWKPWKIFVASGAYDLPKLMMALTSRLSLQELPGDQLPYDIREKLGWRGCNHLYFISYLPFPVIYSGRDNEKLQID